MAEVQSAPNGKPRFSRILLKLSGEALAPAQGSGLDLDVLARSRSKSRKLRRSAFSWRW